MTIVEFLNARLDEQEADGRSLDYLQTGEFLVADAAAKRAIIANYVAVVAADEYEAAHVTDVLWPLRCLAAVYADHPDYNPEWKP